MLKTLGCAQVDPVRHLRRLWDEGDLLKKDVWGSSCLMIQIPVVHMTYPYMSETVVLAAVPLDRKRQRERVRERETDTD